MDTTLLIGTIGAAILLAAFTANEFGKLNRESLWYDGGNLVGAVLLLIYAALLGSLPFIILETVWALVALRDVVIRLARGPKTR